MEPTNETKECDDCGGRESLDDHGSDLTLCYECSVKRADWQAEFAFRGQ